MSGTEAVMQAVRLARYHTRRDASGALLRRLSRLVGRRAAGRRQSRARAARPTRSRTCPRDTLRVLRDAPRHRLRARQSLAGAASQRAGARAIPRWSTARAAPASIVRPTRRGCGRLREVCTQRGIVLIFDEMFVGFRLAPGGAQEYFGVRADIVTYGKTLGGGLPVGVVCGRRPLMKRYRDDRPADVCFARGTFNSHPYVMAAMHEFLRQLETPQIKRALRRPGRDLERRAPRISTAASRRRRLAGPHRQHVDRSGRSSIRSPPATTGCSSTTCAPRAWR